MKEIKPEFETYARIKVVGIGGGGNNAISRMTEANLKGIDFIAINTDAQDLHHCKVSEKIHIGKNLTRGLGAGMNPDVGRQAAEENKDEIQDALKNSDMVFITCGLGGGTGTGAAPIIAETARDAGALTVAIVTKPFAFEGLQRKRIAEEGLENLKNQVDTIITIPNDKILQVIDKKNLLLESFKIADDILRQGVQGISDLITTPGIVNVDFADVKAIMENTGPSLMGIGKASGESRAVEAAKQAINSPLLELSVDGAKGVLFNVSGGSDLTMMEINEAANIITESIDTDAKVIFGAITDESLKKGEIKVTVIATGFGDQSGRKSDLAKTRENFEIEFKTETKDAETKETEIKVENKEVEELAKEKENEVVKEKDKKSTGGFFSPNVNPIKYDDEYDVPAFIRKKMNKKKGEE